MALPVLSIALHPAAVLGSPFLVVHLQLGLEVGTHGATPRHLQRPGSHFVGNILRTGESCLEDAVIVADVNISLRYAKLTGARRRQRQLGELSPIWKRRSVQPRERHGREPAFAK